MNTIKKENKKSDELLEKILNDVIKDTDLELKDVLKKLEEFEKNKNS